MPKMEHLVNSGGRCSVSAVVFRTGACEVARHNRGAGEPRGSAAKRALRACEAGGERGEGDLSIYYA